MSSPHPIPRYRRWAARFTLLGACMATLASSQPQSPDVFAEYAEAPPLRLTTDAPSTTRSFKVQVFSDHPSSEPVEITVEAEVNARWRPSDPSSTVKPWFLARLSLPSENLHGSPAMLIIDPSGQPATAGTRVYSGNPHCKLEPVCEWNVLLDFELQSNAAAGTVDVDWTVKATAHALDTDELPKGFTVRISEG